MRRILADLGPAAVLSGIGALALIASASSASGLGLALPLDDAYIHLGLARTLVETGTWGVNPGELASASSSPLWTALVALGLLVGAPPVALALGLSAAAGVVALGLGAAWLVDEGVEARAMALIGLTLAVPLPFLMALGMEHTLQLASVLALVRAGERVEGARRLGALAALAALAVMTRYEAIFVCGWMAVGMAWGRRWGAALAVGGGGLAAVTAFGAWCAAQGGPWVPASLLLKTPVGHDLWAGLRSNLEQGVPLLALAVLVAALPAGELHRRRVALFVPVVLTHLVFARVGWLFRYEAWLVGWGALLLAGALQGGRGRLAAALVAVPLTARSVEAMRLYVPGTVFNAQTDLLLAGWVRDQWPGARVATQDLGALSLLTDNPLTDLSGLGDTEILHLRQQGRLNGEEVSALLRRRGVDLALTGADWMAADRPAVFTPLGELEAPWERGGPSTRMTLWAVSDAARSEGPARLDALEAALPTGVVLHRELDKNLDVTTFMLAGAAVQREGSSIAFYTGGSASFEVPVTGRLTLTLDGSVAEGRGPRFRVERAMGVIEGATGPQPTRLELGSVRAGETLRIVYEDDLIDAEGHDRNLFLRAVTVTPGP